MARYVSPVNPAIFATLTLVLLGIGLFFTAWFFVYEVTSTKFTREMPKELLISVVASIFMGLGSHFLILWVGIYVWIVLCWKVCCETTLAFIFYCFAQAKSLFSDKLEYILHWKKSCHCQTNLFFSAKLSQFDQRGSYTKLLRRS